MKSCICKIGMLCISILPFCSCGGGGVNSSPKEWSELISFNGSGDKKSEAFIYDGGDAKLAYDFKTNNSYGGAFVVYVVKKGVDINETGGFPELTLNTSESGESSLSHLSKGEYYLNVMSANGTWSISVQELK